MTDTARHESTSEAQIEIKGLGKTFQLRTGPMLAANDITVSIPRGQFTVLVGPSGCGKTTLLRILAGLESHTEGTLNVQHFEVTKPMNSMVFQEQSIFPWLTVEDNVAFGLRMRKVPRAEIQEVVNFYLDKVGLNAFRRAFPHQLSGGMKQRVSIARAFANDPEVLLMDEPFAALDEQNKALLQQELLRIWEGSRKTVVFITHSIDEALILGDRVLVMTARPGTIKADIAVPFERPRKVFELKALPEFGEMVYTVWEHLREEVMLAKQKEMEAR